MAKVFLENSSPVFVHTNEVKMGVNANSSCDPDLENLGVFELEPNEKIQIAEVDENTGFYWKNIYEYSWTYKKVLGADDEEVIYTSSKESSSEAVDICDASLNETSLRRFSVSEYTATESVSSSGGFDVGNGVRFYIVGRNRDGYQIRKDGELISYEWLWPHASDPGSLYRGELESQQIGGDGVNVAFRWGINNDLMFAIAVRGYSVVSTIGKYWVHPSRSAVSINWDGESLARFSAGGIDKFLKFSDNKWQCLQ